MDSLTLSSLIQFSNLALFNHMDLLETDYAPLIPHIMSRVAVLLICYFTPLKRIWRYGRFEYRLRVTLGRKGNLIMTYRIKNTNTDGNPFNFTFAYHNYFPLSNISEAQVEGLQNLDNLDNLQNMMRLQTKMMQ